MLVLALPFSQSWADGKLKLQKVTEDVYAIVGELGNRTPDNLGNNATFGFVVTPEGVVLIDSGGTYQGAQNIDMLIKSITGKPVVTVINTGGQDHRWLGNYCQRKSSDRPKEPFAGPVYFAGQSGWKGNC